MVAQPLLFALYVALAVGGPWLEPPGYKAGEIFPFFNWSLFSSPLRRGGMYSVRVLAAARPDAPAAELIGRVVDDPQQAAFLRDIRFQKSALALARAVRRGDEAETARHARAIGNFLAPLGVSRYELVQLRYDLLEFLHDPDGHELVTVTQQTVEAD